MRECIENAFFAAGGRDYLVWVAQRRADVFCQLLAKIIPTETRMTVLAGYQAMQIPVEQREAIPAIAAPGAAEAAQAPAEVGPLPDPIPQAIGLIALDDWLGV